jgi:penicillin-binding protein 1C
MTSPSSKRRLRRWLRRAAWLSGAIVMAALVFVAVIEELAGLRAYPVEDLAPAQGSLRIFDEQGRLLRETVGDGGVRLEWTPLAKMSRLAIDATIAAEDVHFRDHAGVRWRSVARATGQLVLHGHVVSGASTLTMQVVRLVHPHGHGLGGKLGEMVDALRLERAIDKDAILEQYLNRSPYGADTVGIEAASRRYFGKPSLHLSLAEAAMLAGLPQAPSRLDPLAHLDDAKARQRVVLERMQRAEMIADGDFQRARAELLRFAAAPAPPKAMHFTEWIRGQRPESSQVATTLDGDLQVDIEHMVADHVRANALAGMTDAAVVVLDNERCTVQAMIGSPDYRDPRGGAVNGALARRQPGSTLKPFTYALAFERGDTPASVVADIETKYGAADGFLFSPQNYSQTFLGPVLMDEALARSLNIPALRVLAKIGPGALLDRLHAVGFASLDQPASHYGLGLTLGDGEVTLVELAQAYAMLARGGVTCTATGISGQVTAGARVFSPSVAWLVTHILSDETIRAAAFGPTNALMLGYPVAIKTGTSSNWRDSWTIGYTPRFTVAVWAGDYDGKPMNHLAGGAGAGPLFRQIMNRIVEHTSVPHPVAAPDDIVEVSVCAVSGKLAGKTCSHTRSVQVPLANAPTSSCDWHRELAIDTRNGLLAGDRCPSRFVEHRTFELLPATYATWLATASGRATSPSAYSPLCPQTGAIPNEVVVIYPRPQEVFVIEPGYDAASQTLPLAAEIDPPTADAEWLVDGTRVGHGREVSWPLAAGRHRVEVVALGHHSEPVEFVVQ